MASDSERNI